MVLVGCRVTPPVRLRDKAGGAHPQEAEPEIDEIENKAAERDAADETFSLENRDDGVDDGVSRLAGAIVRLTDPEGLMVSTEIISTLIARMPSLEAL